MLHASGEGWVGAGIRSIETGMHELFTGARRRIVGSAYAISSGAFDLPGAWIEAAALRGVNIVLVVNRFDEKPASAMKPLEAIARATGRVELWDYSGPEQHDLHAKAIVADDARALIGSSNLSGNGLLRNHELAVLVEGPEARLASNLILQLTRSTYATRRV